MFRSLVSFERRDGEANVLVVTSGWPRADNPAYCIFIQRQIESLTAQGLKFDVLVIRGHRSVAAYPISAVLLAGWSLRRRRYSLVHAHGGEAALVATFYVRAPILASYLGSDLLGSPRADGSFSVWSRVRRSILRTHSRLMTATITKSREMESVLPASVRRRNSVIPNGVDMNLFSPIARDAARRRLDWDLEERIVLFVGNPLVPRKRHWLAEASCRMAGHTVRRLSLRVVSGVDPTLLPLLMSAADCLLLTSSVEGSPNVVKEALMCDLPIVATAVGDVEELVQGVVPSFVCDSTPEALSRGLIACLKHDGVRSNGRSRSLANLAEGVIANRIVQVYAQLGVDVGED